MTQAHDLIILLEDLEFRYPDGLPENLFQQLLGSFPGIDEAILRELIQPSEDSYDEFMLAGERFRLFPDGTLYDFHWHKRFTEVFS